MRPPLLALFALVALACAFAIACGDASDQAPPYSTPEPHTVTGEFTVGATVSSADGRLQLLTQSEAPVGVSVREVPEPAALPQGWHRLLPVYEIKFSENGVPAATLSVPVSMRLAAPVGGLAAALLYDGTTWRLLPGERDSQAILLVTATQGGVLTVAQPINPNLTPTPVPTIVIAPRATATPTDAPGGPVLGSTPTPEPTVTPTPRPGGSTTVALAAVTRSNVQPFFERFFDRRLTSTLAFMPVEGATFLDLPVALATALAANGGSQYAAVSGGVNEIIATATLERPAAASFTGLFVEPRLSMPESAAAAETALRADFAGVPGVYTPRTSASGGFAFSAAESGVAYLFGFARHSGLIYEYALVGTGTNAAAVSAAAQAAP